VQYSPVELLTVKKIVALADGYRILRHGLIGVLRLLPTSLAFLKTLANMLDISPHDLFNWSKTVFCICAGVVLMHTDCQQRSQERMWN